jgi:hypothetical protein
VEATLLAYDDSKIVLPSSEFSDFVLIGAIGDERLAHLEWQNPYA